MKFLEVSTIFKKNDDVDKEYYRPVSVLFNLSKKRIMSNLLISFRKIFSAQHCLIYMLEISKNILDKEGCECATFINSSKAFNTIHHDSMISKLGASCFSEIALQYMRSY